VSVPRTAGGGSEARARARDTLLFKLYREPATRAQSKLPIIIKARGPGPQAAAAKPAAAGGNCRRSLPVASCHGRVTVNRAAGGGDARLRLAVSVTVAVISPGPGAAVGSPSHA
jgi:hypothetical protein